jgi:hypothetical protein
MARGKKPDKPKMPRKPKTLGELLPYNSSQSKSGGKRPAKKQGQLKLLKQNIENGTLTSEQAFSPDIAAGIVISKTDDNIAYDKAQNARQVKGTGEQQIGYRVLVREWDKQNIKLDMTIEEARNLNASSVASIYYPANAQVQEANIFDQVLVRKMPGGAGVYLGKLSARPQRNPLKNEKKNNRGERRKADRKKRKAKRKAARGSTLDHPLPLPNTTSSGTSWGTTLRDSNPFDTKRLPRGRGQRTGAEGGNVPLFQDEELRGITQDIQNSEYLAQFYPALQQQLAGFTGLPDADGNLPPFPSYGTLPPQQRVTTQVPRFNQFVDPIAQNPFGTTTNQQTTILPPGQEVRADINESLNRARTVLSKLGARMIIKNVSEEITTAGDDLAPGESIFGFDAAAALLGQTKIKTTIFLDKNSGSLRPSRRGDFNFDYFLTMDGESPPSKGRFMFNVWAVSDKPLGTKYTDPDTGREFQVELLPLLYTKGNKPKPNVFVCRNADEAGVPFEDEPGLAPATREVYQTNVVNLTTVMRVNGFSRKKPSRPWISHCNPRLKSEYTNEKEYNISPRWYYFEIKRTYYDPGTALERFTGVNLAEDLQNNFRKNVQNWIDRVRDGTFRFRRF